MKIKPCEKKTATDLCTGVWQKKCTWRPKPHYGPLMQIHIISMWMSRWIHFRCKYAHAADLSYSFDILASCQPDTPSLTIYNERLILDFKQTDASHLHFSVTYAFGSALFGNCCLIFTGIIWNEVLLCPTIPHFCLFVDLFINNKTIQKFEHLHRYYIWHGSLGPKGAVSFIGPHHHSMTKIKFGLNFDDVHL